MEPQTLLSCSLQDVTDAVQSAWLQILVALNPVELDGRIRKSRVFMVALFVPVSEVNSITCERSYTHRHLIKIPQRSGVQKVSPSLSKLSYTECP